MSKQDSSSNGQRGVSRSCLIVVALLIAIVVVVFIVIRQVGDAISSAFTSSTNSLTSEGTLSSDVLNQTQEQRWYTDYGLLTTPLPPGTDPSHFDPFAAYPQIVAFVGGDVALHSIEISYIRADGTMDLNDSYSPGPHAEYKFIRSLATPPANAPPVGAGGGNNDWYVSVTVKIHHPGDTMNIKSGLNSFFFTNKGMESDTGHPENDEYANRIPTPTCAFTKLWSDAIAKGAPRDAVATISYDAGGYSFSMYDIDFFMHFDPKCVVTSVEGPRATSTSKAK